MTWIRMVWTWVDSGHTLRPRAPWEFTFAWAQSFLTLPVLHPWLPGKQSMGLGLTALAGCREGSPSRALAPASYNLQLSRADYGVVWALRSFPSCPQGRELPPAWRIGERQGVLLSWASYPGPTA